MTESKSDTRTLEHEIEIDAPADAVWRAITTGEGLTAWFLAAASVEPGAGGRISRSWGEGEEEVAIPIQEWKENELLRLGYDPEESDTNPWAGIVEEYRIEHRGGSTVLRLVTSGLPTGDDWDESYDGLDVGWTMYFIALKHYVEKHAGVRRVPVTRFGTVPFPLTETWRRIGRLLGGIDDLATGERYSRQALTGDRLEGEVYLAAAPKSLSLSVEGLGEAVLSVALNRAKKGTYVNFDFGTFGLPAADVEALAERWTAALDELLFAAD